MAGQTERAEALARRALDLARANQERGHEAYVLHFLGTVAADRDPPEVKEADAYYRRAWTQAEELGMRPLVAHCHLGLGKLYRRTGKCEQAPEHLTTATTMYREMEMTY